LDLLGQNLDLLGQGLDLMSRSALGPGQFVHSLSKSFQLGPERLLPKFRVDPDDDF